MPHQCTGCERVFADGSKEMLSGCPNCGGTTFQYLPDGTTIVPDDEPPARPGDDGGVTGTVGRAATKLRDVVASNGDTSAGPPSSPGEEDAPAGTPAAEHPGTPGPEHPGTTDTAAATAGQTDDDPRTAGEDAGEPARAPAHDGDGPEGDGRDAEIVDGDGPEDLAQSSARRDVVSQDELPDGFSGVAGSPDPAALQRTPDAPDDGAGGHAGASADARAPTDGATEGQRAKSDSEVAANDDGHAAPAEDGQPATATGDNQPAPATGGRVVDTPGERTPDLAELREELNDQFEGIKIREPGNYELNLMELYEREETIIALKENGHYVIEVPESWRGEHKH